MRRTFSLVLACTFALCAGLVVAALGAREALSAPYAQVVDNSTSGRFAAPGWGTSSYSKATMYGPNYRYAEPSASGKAAKYKIKIPTTGTYTVFARWPSNPGYNSAARFAVSTASGVERRTVDQRANGGKWRRLGAYRMSAGDGYYVRVSRNVGTKGYVIADAVKVVRGDVTTAGASSGGASSGGGSSGGGTSGGSTSAQKTGADVLAEAKTWLGVPYKYGGTSRSGVDCSGLTYSVFRALGITLPRVASDQYYSGPGTKVSTSDLRRGYLVFGHADGGSGIQHVGIVTGDGRMIHAPQPGTVVRYDNLPAGWYHVVGVKRIVPAS